MVPRGRGGDRVVVRLGARERLELAQEIVLQEGLQVGMFLTAAMVEELIGKDAPYRARERALRLLGIRERSGKELESRLKGEGLPAEAVTEAIAWLRARGYVDDVRFATDFVQARLANGWGPGRIRAGLRQKGVESSVIEQALREAVSGSGQGQSEVSEQVLELARRRFAAQFATNADAAARRLAGFLARRGHDWDTIAHIEATLRAEAAASEGRSEDMGDVLS